MRTPIAGLIVFAIAVASCAPNGSSASSMIPSNVRIAQEQDALPQSCQSRGTIPVERRETLKRRVLAARANLVRYPIRDNVLSIYQCHEAEIEKFYVWNAG